MPNPTLTCCVCNDPMARSATSKPQGEAAHDRCRRSTVVNHGESGYKRGCRCDICRLAKNARMRQYAASRKDRGLKLNSTRLRREARGLNGDTSIACFICKQPLVNVRTDTARYPLHKSCRRSAPNWIRRGLDNPRRAEFQAKIDKAAAGTSGKRVFTVGNCPWCGEHFVRAGKFCSRRCATAQKYADRGGGFKIAPISRLSIYERDGWICQLCDHPVDPELHYLDDWSATLDHIIPQSHMLIPDHSPANLRLAHRWCNSARGDGSNLTEEAFRSRIVGLRKALIAA